MRVKATIICAKDVKIWHGQVPFVTFPHIPGHQFCGEIVEAVMELTGGVGADMIVECTGQPDPAAEALHMVRKNGRISYNGIYHDPVTLDLDKIVQWNLTITGPKAEGMLNLERAIPLMADGRINLKPLITHTFPLDEINKAFDTFTGRVGGAIKVIVKP